MDASLSFQESLEDRVVLLAWSYLRRRWHRRTENFFSRNGIAKLSRNPSRKLLSLMNFGINAYTRIHFDGGAEGVSSLSLCRGKGEVLFSRRSRLCPIRVRVVPSWLGPGLNLLNQQTVFSNPNGR